MNQTELADALGITKQAVSKLKKQGMPVTSLHAAQAWRAENLNAARSEAMLRSASREPLAAALLRKMIAEAGLAELRCDRLAASLISVSAVQQALRADYQQLAAGADALVKALAPRLCVMTDAAEIHATLDIAIREYLQRECAR
ncbi:hypothetical protein [Hydrogenophaga sp.]|uniref:hypothetical protein n=1 Tax=Hydrogenophaga sp. TaxID=1904254 RepID=UPI002AB9686D|nr:hypothetical protein [Hydrogenophaga sp.]MDZ4397977.1 hypothetical protein [Hydrogenophaga sp.]